MFRRAMDYLGLGPDDAYDDYDASVARERPVRARQQRLGLLRTRFSAHLRLLRVCVFADVLRTLPRPAYTRYKLQ
ncbi:MAG: hypothetical protein ACKOEK_06265, partial [Actinomycetota bacterium]